MANYNKIDTFAENRFQRLIFNSISLDFFADLYFVLLLTFLRHLAGIRLADLCLKNKLLRLLRRFFEDICRRAENEDQGKTNPADHPDEGKIIDGLVMICGERFPLQDYIDYCGNKADVVVDAFNNLDTRAQADVLAGRYNLEKTTPADPILPPGCNRRCYVGTRGKEMCDACFTSRKDLADFEGLYEDDIELDVCPRCRYAACENCQSHHSRGTCYCKDSNFGWDYPPHEEREWYQSGYW